MIFALLMVVQRNVGQYYVIKKPLGHMITVNLIILPYTGLNQHQNY